MQPTELDQYLHDTTPVEVVPRFGTFEAMERNGHRFLAAADGLWVECRRDWLHAIVPLALQDTTPMPFGRVTPSVALAYGRLPVWVIDRFIATARRHHPREVGAVVTWSATTREFSYHECEVLESSASRLRQQYPALGEDDMPVLDLHSHGSAGAFFSSTDLKDTASEVIAAGVLGRVMDDRPELKLSLFVCGIEVPTGLSPELLEICSSPARYTQE